MNHRLVWKQLGIVAMLIGGIMLFSLPWAMPTWGVRDDMNIKTAGAFETQGFLALLGSLAVSLVCGAMLWRLGRDAKGSLYRKEAMAVVGLSWLLATFLGALPFWFSQTSRGPAIRLDEDTSAAVVADVTGSVWGNWIVKPQLTPSQFQVVAHLLHGTARGLTADEIGMIRLKAGPNDEPVSTAADVLRQLADDDEDWARVLLFPSDDAEGRQCHYRVRHLKMNLVDCLFESQSGFSTTGATVISELEDPTLVPHCILFWRSSTHFLGGLGIIVLFVVILGQGSAGKALMRAEMPGPTQENAQSRTQHTAWIFAAIYVALNIFLTFVLKMCGLTWFDAVCHAFGTMATGGFSTYNSSLGHFENATIEYTVVVFMILAGTNFSLLYLILLGRPQSLFRDVEWRTYILLIVGVTITVMTVGLAHHDFTELPTDTFTQRFSNSLRYGLFQVVAVMTTTGYGTDDFDSWNQFGRAALFLLMFVGGCAGSTGGGMKVIRHVLFVKILGLEIERAYHPTVVRPLRLGGLPVEAPDLRRNILVYFALIFAIFTLSCLLIVAVEADATWGAEPRDKLIDTASAVAATLNNIGPGLGTVGSTKNYGHFSDFSKLLFTYLMMLGRVEVLVILALFAPRFWRYN